jgi:hypothetical protein
MAVRTVVECRSIVNTRFLYLILQLVETALPSDHLAHIMVEHCINPMASGFS